MPRSTLLTGDGGGAFGAHPSMLNYATAPDIGESE
jgi:hypothetical protein